MKPTTQAVALPYITKEMLPTLTELGKLTKRMKKRAVSFVYLKDDGTIRYAFGTTNPELIPTDKRPKGTSKRKAHPELINYYDFYSSSWASFRPRNFQRLVKIFKPVL